LAAATQHELAVLSVPGMTQMYAINEVPFSSLHLLPRQSQSLARFEPGDRIEGMVNVPTDELLPDWLGPRVPGVGAENVLVRWQVTVP
jgi:hypothetical protein